MGSAFGALLPSATEEEEEGKWTHCDHFSNAIGPQNEKERAFFFKRFLRVVFLVG